MAHQNNTRKLIETEFKEIREHYNDINDRHLFAMWCLSAYHYNSSFSSSDLGDVFERTYQLLGEGGTSGDQQLDGYFFNEEENTLFLYQTKWPDTTSKRQGITEAKEIANAATALLKDLENEATVGESRGGAIEALRHVRTTAGGKLILRSVTGSLWQKDYTEQISKLVDSTLSNITEVQMIGIKDLEKVFSNRTGDLSGEKVSFLFYPPTEDPIMIYPPGNSPGIGKSIVALIAGTSIGEAAMKWGRNLFDKNVRSYLGSGKRVNKAIVEALIDNKQRKIFWYGHNGITILCDEFHVQKSSSSGKYHQVDAINPQIVNGCQTASSIGDVMNKEGIQLTADDFGILTRFIQLKGDDSIKRTMAGRVAYGTNNQSPINAADLLSNDPKQLFFEQLLKKYGNGWYYERKVRGFMSLPKRLKRHFKDSNGPDRVIERDLYQQAWRSFFNCDPAGALGKKNYTWTPEGADLYSKIFSQETRPCDVVFIYTLWSWFDQIYKLKNNASLSTLLYEQLEIYNRKISRAKRLVVAHSVALFAYLLSKKYEEGIKSLSREQVEHLTNCLDRKNFVEKNWPDERWKKIEPAIQLILQSWAHYLRAIKDREQEGETLHSHLKKGEAMVDLKGHMDDALRKDEEYILWS